MANLARRASLTAAVDTLLRDLEPTWTAADIAYVRDEVAHYEFDDALENLVALGLNHGTHFSAPQRMQVEAMAALLGIDGSPVLARLKTEDMPARRTG